MARNLQEGEEFVNNWPKDGYVNQSGTRIMPERAATNLLSGQPPLYESTRVLDQAIVTEDDVDPESTKVTKVAIVGKPYNK